MICSTRSSNRTTARILKNSSRSGGAISRSPGLKFYIGELCTKTVWGMDNRENMYAIRAGQKSVTTTDLLAEYILTSHVGVEIGGDEGLHYHYGTLGQLEHGVNYADAYLRTIGKTPAERPLKTWPYAKGSAVKLFVLAGHRNMEGERAFAQELKALAGKGGLVIDNNEIAFKYHLGGGFKPRTAGSRSGPLDPTIHLVLNSVLARFCKARPMATSPSPS